MNYTINSLKVTAEVLDEMPTSPNQQGLGFGVYLDGQNPNDGESLNAIEKSIPVASKDRCLNKYINKPNKTHMIAFEDLLAAGEPLEKMIRMLKDQNVEGIKTEMADQFKKFPRVNN